MISLVMACEKAFNVDLPDDDLADARTVGDLTRTILEVSRG